MNEDIYTVVEAVVIEIFCPIKCISFAKISISLAFSVNLKKNTINPDQGQIQDLV